ncbi:NAD(P)/FAD-dependent oxidoreductase [Fodinicurvata halophila]|uniref:NAD(P)/FAD-dependent oxidoreductase n=1 Tax=Fodinicurvata halophila TaxID=1419723 RepID=A0ABV8UIR5_9PROT
MMDLDRTPLQSGYDVAVIGGGTAGCSAALFLALRGLAVVLFERHQCGSQASGVNYGGVRQHGRHRAEIPLSIKARTIWDELPDLIGHDCEFDASGHVKLARTQDDMGELEAWARVARDFGLEVELVTGNQLRDRFDYLGSSLAGASIMPQDGQANPRLVAPHFARAAESAGADIREGVDVAAAEREGTNFRIELSDGRTAFADVLVNTAGAWGYEVAASFGESVAEAPLSPNMLVTEPLPYRIKCSFGMCGGDIYARQIPRGNVIFGGGTRAITDFEKNRTRPRTSSSQLATRNLIHAMPFLAEARIIRSWSGIDGLMPDKIPVVGPSSTTAGLFHAFGFSGHGFQLGPAIGAVLGDLILDGRTDTSIEELSITRFTQDGAGVRTTSNQLNPSEQGE